MSKVHTLIYAYKPSYTHTIIRLSHTQLHTYEMWTNPVFSQYIHSIFCNISYILLYTYCVCACVCGSSPFPPNILSSAIHTHAIWYGLVKQMLLLVFGWAYLDVWAATRPDVDRWYLFYSYRSSMLCVCALFVRCVRFWPLIVSRCVRVRACVCLSDSNIMRLCTETKPPKPKTTLCELKTK